MTIFPRGELGGWFLVMFFSLLAGKVWAWIGEGRVEFLEQQPPSNPRLFHTRLATSLALSILFNTWLLEYSVKTVLRQARPDMMVMFGFEFAVLSITSISTAARYWISLMEIYIVRKQKKEIIEERRQEIRRQREAANDTSETGAVPARVPAEDEEIDEIELDVPGWEEKGRWVFYLDLVTDFLKLNVYLAFFTILLTFYGLPIHIIRDVFFTCRSFINRIKDFMRYRTATRDMNERYPDATAEEVAGADVCIICREEMVAWGPPPTVDNGHVETETRRRMRNNLAERMRPKKLPCGHVLHFSCLRSWLERQQNCPTCRRPVLSERRLAGAGDGADGADGHQPGQGANGDVNANNLANRARIINLGPLRIGFGAGRGNFFNDLAQQVHDGQARPAPDAAANAAGPQQFGFGLGWNRNQAQDNRRNATSGDMQDQIRALEQRIQQEINGLRVAADQLHLIRGMQGELARLRINNANGGTNGASATVPPNAPGPRPAFSLNTTPFMPTPPQVYAAGGSSTTITAGSSQLPQGLVLPEGWSMLPLHRADQGLSSADVAPSNLVPPPSNGQPTATTSSQPPNGIPAVASPSDAGPVSSVTQAPNISQSGTEILPSRTSPAPLERAIPIPGQGQDTATGINEAQPHLVAADGVSSEPAPTETSSGPSWSFGAPEPQKDISVEQGDSSVNGVESNEMEEATSTSPRGATGSDKGKGKAVTVEDIVEDVD